MLDFRFKTFSYAFFGLAIGILMTGIGCKLAGNPIVPDAPPPILPLNEQVPLVHVYHVEHPDAPVDYALNAKHIRARVRELQQFFGDEMVRHGYARKTFDVKRDSHGRIQVERLWLSYPLTEYWAEQLDTMYADIEAQHGIFAHSPQKSVDIYFIDIPEGACGWGWGTSLDATNAWGHGHGRVFVYKGDPNVIQSPADCWQFEWTAHELGHGFGLQHDWRNGEYIMSYGWTRKPPDFIEALGKPDTPMSKISTEAAAQLNLHPAFQLNP